MPQFDINDVKFNVVRAGSGPPLVLLHGFTGSAENWIEHTAVMGASFTTYAVDLIGHGQTDSPDDMNRYAMSRCVDDLVALFDRLQLAQPVVLGYSMGGRVALHLALKVPDRVRALILESASPGIDDPDQRATRISADQTLADSIDRDGLDAFVEHWESLALFASQCRLPNDVRQRHREQRLRNDPLGLSNSLRGMGAGAMEPVWGKLSALSMPALLVVGALDEKFVKQASEMKRLMPNARVAVVEDAGHTVHLEQPQRFDRLVLTWLEGVIS